MITARVGDMLVIVCRQETTASWLLQIRDVVYSGYAPKVIAGRSDEEALVNAVTAALNNQILRPQLGPPRAAALAQWAAQHALTATRAG